MEAVTLTEAATARMNKVLDGCAGDVLVLSVSGRGCGGFSYTIDEPTGEVEGPTVSLGGDRILVVDEISVPLLLGTKIDWKETAMAGSFTFDNPMAGGTCGCGTSFSPR
jgi:iron-sulfur cluster assembly protein